MCAIVPLSRSIITLIYTIFYTADIKIIISKRYRRKMNGHKSWTNSKNSTKRVENSDALKGRKKNVRKPLPRPHETEEEAIIRRYHDAQRMARFRARRKKALEEAKALQATQLAQLAVISELKRRNITFQISDAAIKKPNHDQGTEDHIIENTQFIIPSIPGQSKYSQLLSVIEEIGKDIKLSYAGSRSSAERLKAGIIQAKMLVKECLLETKLNSKQ